MLTWEIIGLLAIGTVVGVTALYNYTNHDDQMAELYEEKQALEEELADKEQTVDEMMATFDKIEYNLDIINHKERLIEDRSQHADFSEDSREGIVQDIQFINTLLDESQKEIADLRNQLRNSDAALASFKSKAGKLNDQLTAKEEQISELKTQLNENQFTIEELNERMNDLLAEVERQKEVIESIDRELHLAYVAQGSYQELKEMGIVEKEGGFLWIGRTKTIEENAPDELFREIDIRNTKTLPIAAKKAKLITQHPEESYSFEKEGGQIAALHIENPEEFWKVSDYLVLEVK